MVAQALRTSTQVLQELFVTLTRKIRTRLTAEQALRYLDQIDVEAVNPFRDRTKKR
jgi:predicted nucleic acid-binding protein